MSRPSTWRSPMSLASSFREIPAGAGDVIFGEVGLTGEVRAVSRVEQRVKEAEKLGFHRVIVPQKSLKGWQPPEGIEVIGVQTVQEALAVVLGEGDKSMKREKKSRSDEYLLKWWRPGTPFREGLENVLRAKTGALIVVGY